MQSEHSAACAHSQKSLVLLKQQTILHTKAGASSVSVLIVSIDQRTQTGSAADAQTLRLCAA